MNSQLSLWKKGWELLDHKEKKEALTVFLVVIIAALSSAAMVASIMPFLSVLGDPELIERVAALKWTYDTFDFDSTLSFLVLLGFASLGMIIFSTLLQLLRAYLVSRFAMMRIHTLSYRLLNSYLRQPYEFFLDSHSGDLGTKILAETQNVVIHFFRPAANIVASLASIIAIVGLLLWINWVVTISCFLSVGLIYLAVLFYSRNTLNRLGAARLEANKKRYRIATEALGGIKNIKLIGREHNYLTTFEKPSKEVAWTQVISQVMGEAPSFVLQGLAFGGMVILTLLLLEPSGIETGQALGGVLPTLGLFAFAGQRLIPEMQRVYQGMTQLQFGKSTIDSLHRDLLVLKKWNTLPQTPPKSLGLRKQLTVEAVSYTYPHSERLGLNNIEFTINAGQKVGIVGSTGAGKTTLADILLGLISPSSGRILVDQGELNAENIRAWQQTVGYVPQDIFLIDATIIENIALGVRYKDIDLQRIKKACEISQLKYFIEQELPQGYDTPVGERGVRLSGGQRQRIGIARALYNNADFFVFDEATSALDNNTEQEVISAINALPGDKTILMIAHRLSTIKVCDRIIVLELGRVVGDGTWFELIENNQSFQRLALERSVD